MQVDLFKDAKISADMRSALKQIESRKFSIGNRQRLLNDLKGSGSSFNLYKNKLLELSKQERKYFSIGGNSCDSLYELELLGIGEYSKKYVVVLDFSDKFDYILHRLCGCSQDDVRKLYNYERVSKSFLNFEVDGLKDIKFKDLFGLSDKLDKYLVDLINKAEEEHSSDYDITTSVYEELFREVLTCVADVKGYVAMCVKQLIPGAVIRSKSFSSVILSSDIKVDEPLQILENDKEQCVIFINSYELMSYAYERGAVK